jgi:microcystin-dependent protein
MSRRFEQFYRVKRRDDIGQPEYWNGRLDDIDRRIDANETDLEDVNGVADRIESVALGRISTVITPLVEEVTTRIRTIPAMFSANSSSNVTIGTGYLTFNIDPGQRNTFAALAYAVVDSVDDPGNGIVGKVVSYDAVDGDLVVDTLQVIGEGTFNRWSVTLSAPPDLVHSTRTDNPHQTTADQVGAYTKAQVDDLIIAAVGAVDVSSQINAIVDGAPADRNTFKKVGALIDSLSKSVNSATNSFSDLLLKRLRVDADQGFSPAEKSIGLRNLGFTADAASRTVIPGTLVWFLAPSPPPGYVKANGALLSRTSYVDLWNFANTYGGITGEATWQGGYYGYFSYGDGSTNFRVPDLRGLFVRAYDDGRGMNPDGNVYGLYRADQNLSHVHGYSNGAAYTITNGAGAYVASGEYLGIGSMNASGGNEARPRSVSLLACIKV